MGSEIPQRAVLFPCTDLSVLLISQYRDQLEPLYHFALPEHEIVETLINKVSFYAYAQRKGLPIPTTFLLRSRLDAQKAAPQLEFPCVFKPAIKTAIWEQRSESKVYKVASAESFLKLYNRCADWAEQFVVQEWIEGPDSNLCSCYCYFNSDSEPLVAFTADKIRQWPPEKGTGSLGQECRNDIVRDQTLELFRSLNHHGFGSLEMKRDEATGNHYITEPSVGRPTGRSAIAEAGGVELIYTSYCDLLALPLPPNREQTYKGAKWIYLRRDFQSALYYWRRGELRFRDWWRSLRGRKRYAVLSLSDPAPFWADIRRTISTIISTRQVKRLPITETTDHRIRRDSRSDPHHLTEDART
ncbi:MAG: carboxylate--amine ligase [Gammaproteobacteria bacterium]|nr:carboxylate--amine ligase [Gammaproteobacteria bacterium]